MKERSSSGRRGARVATAGPALSSVTEAARTLIAVAVAVAVAAKHGLGTNDLIRIIKEPT